MAAHLRHDTKYKVGSKIQSYITYDKVETLRYSTVKWIKSLLLKIRISFKIGTKYLL